MHVWIANMYRYCMSVVAGILYIQIHIKSYFCVLIPPRRLTVWVCRRKGSQLMFLRAINPHIKLYTVISQLYTVIFQLYVYIPWKFKLYLIYIYTVYIYSIYICTSNVFYFCLQRHIMLPTGFPSEQVFEAYLNPVVDDSSEAFSWANPDLHSLRLYPFYYNDILE